MNVCELRLINDYGVTVDRVDFLSEPFTLPLNLRIPKATKRIRETGENLFRDGTDLTSVRYNNAVITLQPRLSFGCSDIEALWKIEALRHQIDAMFEASRNRSLLGYGQRVVIIEDTKGFPLQSNIIDGNFDIEDDWSGSNIAQGAVIGSSVTLTRSPFRTALSTETLENYVRNPGFSQIYSSTPNGWTGTGMGKVRAQITDHIKGVWGGIFYVSGSPGPDASIESATFSLVTNTLYYCEAWIKPSTSNLLPVTLQVVRLSNMTVADSITWSYGDVLLDQHDFSATRRHRQNTYDITSKNEFASSKYLIRKGLVFSAPATDSYFVRFNVTAPGSGNLGNYLVDRVYLTPAANLPYVAKNGDNLDPTVDTSYKGRFPSGWISGRDILNHSDNGQTYHGQDIQESLLINLISHWRLDELSGTRFDSHGTNNLTDASSVGSFIPGKINYAALFVAASTDYLNIADNTSLSVSDIDFTIGAWVYLASKAANRTIISKWNSTTNNREYMLWYDNASDRFAFSVSNNGTAVITVLANNFASPSISTWYYILAWHNPASNTINIRVNHGTADSAAHATGVFNGSSDFIIGATGVPGDYFDGMIDSVSFWKKLLNEYEQARIQNEDSGLDYPFGLYHVNHADIVDIPGDLPALARLRLNNNSPVNIKMMIASLRSFGTPAGQQLMYEHGAGTPTADIAASAGSKVLQTGLTATFSVGSSYYLIHSISERGNLTGTHHLILRVKDTSAIQGNLRLQARLQMAGGGISLTELTPPSPGAAEWSVADMGVIRIPLVSPDQTILYRFFGSPTIDIYAKRITGTENVEYDFLALFPADEWYAVVDCTNLYSSGWVVGDFLNFNSLPDLPSSWIDTLDGAFYSLKIIPTQDVPHLGLITTRENRVEFLWSRYSGPGKQHVVDDYIQVSTQYLSRWL